MGSFFDVMTLNEEGKTRDQFKVFQFCNEMKSGTHNYDLINNSRRQYTIKNIKDAEFMALSPQSSAIIVKTSENTVDVIDGDSMERVFSMKTS